MHLQRMGTYQKLVRNLPQEASNEYLYGSSKRGCCGITLLAEDADIAAVDSAFKLVTSADGRVAREASDHVRDTTRRRIGREPSAHEVSDFLSGSNEGVFRETRGTGVAG